MKSKISKLKNLITLLLVNSIFTPRAFAQMQTMYGIEPDPVPMPPVMYGPPPIFPDPQENLLGFLFAIVRMFAIPILIVVVVIVGIVFLIKKIRTRAKKKSREPSRKNS